MVEVLFQARQVKKHFPIQGGILRGVSGYVRAVDGVSFDIESGKTFGLVGESGCGKSTLGRVILGLMKPTSGAVYYNGHSIFEMKRKEAHELRHQIQVVFQDPESSLNPRLTVGSTLSEAFRVSDQKATRDSIITLLRLVGLDAEHIDRYPHELSGGQKQRVGLARALAVNPKFIVADEPVSALDISIRAQILNLMVELQDQLNLTYLFISHDLSVVRYISDEVAVMYLGKIVEQAPVDLLYNFPKHPYTQALLSAIPNPDPDVKQQRIVLSGDVASPIHPPLGCRFHTRCPYVESRCREVEPEFKRIGECHYVACHLAS
jgi:oligopeptide/dipeptide ABC transporter ATP-binding protein